MASPGLRRNLVVTPAAVILRRPGELGYIYTALLIAAGVAAFGLLARGARPMSYLSIFFGAACLALVWLRQRAGIYVTPDQVAYVDGRKRIELCATPAVAGIRARLEGNVWEYTEQIQFLNADGAVIARFKNELPSGRSVSKWSHRDLQDFAAAAHWTCEIDTSKEHLNRPAPKAGSDED